MSVQVWGDAAAERAERERGGGRAEMAAEDQQGNMGRRETFLSVASVRLRLLLVIGVPMGGALLFTILSARNSLAELQRLQAMEVAGAKLFAMPSCWTWTRVLRLTKATVPVLCWTCMGTGKNRGPSQYDRRVLRADRV